MHGNEKQDLRYSGLGSLRGAPSAPEQDTAAVEDPTWKRIQEITEDQRELRIRAEMAHVVQPNTTIMFLLSRLDRLRAYGS